MRAQKKSDIVLDIGTGKGHTAIALAPHVDRVIAVDSEEDVVAKCRQYIKESRLVDRIEVIAMNASGAFPFDSNSFDIVTCRAAFHHFDKGENTLMEVERILRPGGRFVMMDPYFSSGSLAEWHNIAKKRETDLAGFRTLDEQIALVREVGLEVIAIVPYLFPRSLDEWIADADESIQEELRKGVCSLSGRVRRELHFHHSEDDQEDQFRGWSYAYNVFEMVAVKPESVP